MTNTPKITVGTYHGDSGFSFTANTPKGDIESKVEHIFDGFVNEMRWGNSGIRVYEDAPFLKRYEAVEAILTLIEQEKKELLLTVRIRVAEEAERYGADSSELGQYQPIADYIDGQVAALNNIAIEGEKNNE